MNVRSSLIHNHPKLEATTGGQVNNCGISIQWHTTQQCKGTKNSNKWNDGDRLQKHYAKAKEVNTKDNVSNESIPVKF